MKRTLLFALLSSLTLVACKKQGCTDPNATNYDPNAEKNDGSCVIETPAPTPTPQLPYVAIDTAYTSSNDMVILYADESSLVAGYTRLYTQITDSNGDEVSNATVSYTPMMDMGTMQHSAPVIQPTYNSTTGTYDGAVVFQMSSTAGTWTLNVSVDGNVASFGLTINEPSTKVVGVYQGTDGISYIVSFVRPITWQTGMNDFSIMLHKMESMMSFPAVTDMEIAFTPEMMSMGHGSSGNIDPVHIADGMYSGTVNLSMAGDWRFHLELINNGTTIHSDAFLDILF